MTAVPVSAPGVVGSGPRPSGCAAPATHLRFETSGLVFACCRNLVPLGNVGTESITDIWRGERRRALSARLAADDFSAGCQTCGTEIDLEGRSGSYAATFDRWFADGRDDAWPRRFELNLSNSCNLQCAMCDGESSSAIRIHREGRPPLPAVYGEAFFADLATFLPHLDEVMFGGGEPFLAAEAWRAFELIAEVAPHLAVTIVTNATQWNRRVEWVFDTLAVTPVVSIDAIRPDTFRQIRGTDLEPVLENVRRMARSATDAGRQPYLNVCLMPQNHAELGDLLLWADGHGIAVNVQTVRSPASHSIARSAPDDIAAVAALLGEQDAQVRERLVLNRSAWIAEVERVAAWAAAAAPTAERAASHTVLEFSCAGSGPTDDREAQAELAAFGSDGVVHRLVVDTTDTIVECSSGLTEYEAELTGRSLVAVQLLFQRLLGGPMSDFRVEQVTADRSDGVAEFPEATVRVASVALRDDEGWAATAAYLLAVRRH